MGLCRAHNPQVADASARALAAQVPQRGVHTGQGPIHIRPGKLVVGFDAPIGDGVNGIRIGAQHVPSDLPVKHRGRDVAWNGTTWP